MQRALRYVLVVGGAVVAILLFLLASASDNSASFDKHYPWLLGLNALVAIALLGLVLLLLARLYGRYKRGLFGSRLMARLVLLFAAIGILPGAVIYTVSVQFVSRSIESWFDVRVEAALESGLNLGRAALDGSLGELNARAHKMALEMAELTDSGQLKQLSRAREQADSQEAIIVSATGRVIATDGGALKVLIPDLPTAAMLRQAKTSRGYAGIEGQPDTKDADTSAANTTPPAADTINNLRLRVVVSIPTSSTTLALQPESKFLQLIQPVPITLAENAEALRAAYSEYQERSLSRSGLRKIYLVTLTLTLLLAIFAAIVSAFLIATDLAEPLLLLAEGTKAVAEGDLSPRRIVASSDELGTLTKSFNAMTRQLFEARAAVERNRNELENAKAYLESVLANMSAGVMVLDDAFHLVTCNESVERILQHPVEPYLNLPLSAIDGLGTFAEAIHDAFSAQSARSAGGRSIDLNLHWQQQIEIPRRSNDADRDDDITLLARGSRLPVAGGSGYVVVFDNISEVITAQRSIAWGEVARRLAHEIKNPLTPIQLSAERLRRKYGAGITQDRETFEKLTDTIVRQVGDIKTMVDEFASFARIPTPEFESADIREAVQEPMILFRESHPAITYEMRLPEAPLIVACDRRLITQALTNLVKNATESVQAAADHPECAKAYRGRVLATLKQVEQQIVIEVADNGLGLPKQNRARLLEPYVTTKGHKGTGLGLAIVQKITEQHGGRLMLEDASAGSDGRRGALVRIVIPVRAARPQGSAGSDRSKLDQLTA